MRRVQHFLPALIVLALLGGCAWRYGLSASASVPVPGTYCRPINYGRMVCYEDRGLVWNCVDVRGFWSCELLP